MGGKDGDSVTAAVGGTPGGVENEGLNGDVAGGSEDTVYFGIEFGGGVEDGVDGVGGKDGGAVDAAVGGSPGGGVEDGGAVDVAVGGPPGGGVEGGGVEEGVESEGGKEGRAVDAAFSGSPGCV